MKNPLLQLLAFGFSPLPILDVETIGANPGWPLNLAKHRYSASSDGQLQHFIDGELRATVPPEGWDDYVQHWPEALRVVKQLRVQHVADQAAAQAAISDRVNLAVAALPAGTDPKTAALVKAAVLAAVGASSSSAAAAAPNPMDDPDVKRALAVLEAKGIKATPAA